MKLAIIIAMLLLSAPSFAQWRTNFKEVLSTAETKHKLILLNFSGSDWCAPCVRLKKEIFDTPEFSKMADSCLVLANADFPRSKKNQLDKALQEQNDQLAAQYNNMGKFPLTLILTSDGKVLKTWEGYPKISSGQFVLEVKKLCDEYNMQ